jgi:glycine cleavage system H protein
MSATDVRSDRRYTKDHEWAKRDGDAVLIGVTSFAVEQLGDITLVNIDVRVGDTITAGKAFGTIESVKTLSDLFAPISGKIVRINDRLENAPELVNQDCYEGAWMIALEPSNLHELDGLLDPAAYGEVLKTAAH